jgi:hypothetical protein
MPSGDVVSEHDEILSEAKDIAEEDPELADRFHAVSLGHATFISDLC